MRKYVHFLLPVLAFVLPLGLYLKTLSVTYIPIDSAEFALCLKYWGVCHPPGFPLYVTLGHFFVNLYPFGSVIYRANLFSAIFGAATMFFVYLSLTALKVERRLSFMLAMLLAVSSVFWEFSLAADVFSFGTFLVALAFYLAFSKRTFPAFFVLGLASSHFYLTAVLWPLFGWYFYKESEGQRVKVTESEVANEIKESTGTNGAKVFTTLLLLVLWGVIFTLGFFPQVILYLRMQENPAVNWGHAQGFSGFWYFIRRQEFGSIFLLSNPALTFSVFKLIKQFGEYFVSLLTNFGVILPIAAVLFSFFNFSREVKLLFYSFCLFVVVQLTLLSTIDPSGENNPFQLNKFYLVSFVLVILLAGIVFNFLSKKYFEGGAVYFQIFVGFLVLVYLLTNLRINNYSKNRFSENLVNDALSALPPESVAITLSHVFYFGGRYEQEVKGNFADVDLLYFPNEKNRDNEFYKPGLYDQRADSDFLRTVRADKQIGRAEEYVLSIIAQNLDRDIFILQGTFEEGFFRYLNPYIVPYGLWWRVVPNLDDKGGLFGGDAPFEGFTNAGITSGELTLKQQRLDALSYAVAYHSTGIYYGSLGEFDRAVSYLNRSLAVGGQTEKLNAEKELIVKTRDMWGEKQLMEDERNVDGLRELGGNLYTLGNFGFCEAIFAKVVAHEQESATDFANLASCQASAGKADPAKENYKRALAINPDLEIAKQGLERIN